MHIPIYQPILSVKQIVLPLVLAMQYNKNKDCCIYIKFIHFMYLYLIFIIIIIIIIIH